MLHSLDILKIDPGGGVLWRGSVKSFAAAKARVQMLALSSPGEYIILDEDTGERISSTTHSRFRRIRSWMLGSLNKRECSVSNTHSGCFRCG
jgi:hypothetical protein